MTEIDRIINIVNNLQLDDKPFTHLIIDNF